MIGTAVTDVKAVPFWLNAVENLCHTVKLCAVVEYREAYAHAAVVGGAKRFVCERGAVKSASCANAIVGKPSCKLL